MIYQVFTSPILPYLLANRNPIEPHINVDRACHLRLIVNIRIFFLSFVPSCPEIYFSSYITIIAIEESTLI